MPILYESTELLFNRDLRRLRYENIAYMLNHAYGAYENAQAEANRIEEASRIPMTVESLKPVHFGWSQYGVIPVGDFICTLKENTAFYPVGVYSDDANFAVVKWYRGAKTRYLYDWMTKFVHLLEEKSQTMTPQPVFKGSQTFTFTIVSDDPGRIQLHAWIIAYVVLPETMLEQSICR